MVRGRPFPRSLARLVRGGVASRPPWLATVEKVPPHFAPVVVRRPPRLSYPEDRLREIYLRANPDVRRHPIDLKARSRAVAHTADRFVAVQMRAMREQGLTEGAAYAHAQQVLRESEARSKEQVATLQDALLSDSSAKDQAAKLFLASLKDSKADLQILESLQRAAKVDGD
jgi:hypothetical protein